MAVTDKQLTESYAKADGTRAFTGNVTLDDAAGPALQNEAASATNPTLLPNKTDETAGIGGASGGVSIITDGAERLAVDSAGDANLVSGGFSIGATEVIDSSRNLTNIAALTMSGSFTIGADVVLSRGAANRLDLATDDVLRLTRAAGGSSLEILQTGDSGWRVAIFPDIGLAFGTGDGSKDFSIRRSSSTLAALDASFNLSSGGFQIDGTEVIDSNRNLINIVTLTTSGAVNIGGDLNHDGSNVGLYTATPVSQAAHIVDADGTLADITTKFNTLLVALDADAGVGLLAGV